MGRFYFFLLSVCFLFSSFGHAKPSLWVRPEHPWELGAVIPGLAMHLPGATLITADFPAMRRDLPYFRELSDDEIENWIVSHASLLTLKELAFEGLFFRYRKGTKSPLNNIDSWPKSVLLHPRDYGRAGVLGFGTTSDINFIDMKGLGISPEEDQRSFLLLRLWNDLKKQKFQFLGSEFALSGDQQENLQKACRDLEAQIAVYQAQLKILKEGKPDSRNIKNILKYRIRNLQSELHCWRAYLKAKEGIATYPDEEEKWVREFETAIRGRDYVNGLLSAGRALEEFLAQKSTQRVFKAWAEREPARPYDTIDSYFVVGLPIDIILPDGTTQPAGILGRQAHLRGHQFSITPPAKIVDGYGFGIQMSATGQMVDFEIPTLIVPPADRFLSYDSQGKRQITDRAASLAREVIAKTGIPRRIARWHLNRFIEEVLESADQAAAALPRIEDLGDIMSLEKSAQGLWFSLREIVPLGHYSGPLLDGMNPGGLEDFHELYGLRKNPEEVFRVLENDIREGRIKRDWRIVNLAFAFYAKGDQRKTGKILTHLRKIKEATPIISAILRSIFYWEFTNTHKVPPTFIPLQDDYLQESWNILERMLTLVGLSLKVAEETFADPKMDINKHIKLGSRIYLGIQNDPTMHDKLLDWKKNMLAVVLKLSNPVKRPFIQFLQDVFQINIPLPCEKVVGG